MKHISVWLLLISLLSLDAKCQNDRGRYAIDEMLSKWQSLDMPGVAIKVVQRGHVIYENHVGLADIKKNIKIDSTTQFWIASVTKQFTAAGIYLLESQGRIDLNHSIRVYLKDLPQLFQPVTLNHLLHHTSGIRDGFVLTALSKKGEESYTNENVFKYLKMQEKFNFRPGSEFEYNNSGYVLLASVIEHVSKKSYPDFMKSEIFEPLGMSHSYVSGAYLMTPQLAKGYHSSDYSNKPGTFEEQEFRGNTYGSTGVITTSSDLVKWATAIQAIQHSGKFPAIFQKMLQQGKLNNGSSITYAGGLERFLYYSQPVYEHFGADEGFKANMIYFPNDALSIIGLTNNSTDYQLSQKLYSIADKIKGVQHNDDASFERDTIVISEGFYYGTQYVPGFRKIKRYQSHVAMSESVTANQIMHRKRGDTIVANYPVTSTYIIDKKDHILINDLNGGTSRRLSWIEPVKRTEDLNKFVGTYYSTELETSYDIKLTNNQIVFEFVPGLQIPLFRITENDFVFEYSGSNFIQFDNTGFKFSREGCRNLSFKKK